jgi:hypothetical protein
MIESIQIAGIVTYTGTPKVFSDLYKHYIKKEERFSHGHDN